MFYYVSAPIFLTTHSFITEFNDYINEIGSLSWCMFGMIMNFKCLLKMLIAQLSIYYFMQDHDHNKLNVGDANSR